MRNFPHGKKYSIIYADPPWIYHDKRPGGRGGSASYHRVSSDDEIFDLSVQSIAADDSWLFLWITFPRLFCAEDLMQRWGYQYKTCAFVWIKGCKKQTTKPFMGLGSYTRANAELCLLGKRGKPKRQSARVQQVIFSPIGRPAEKPQEARNRIIELCGDLPRIELYARGRVPGWDVWGDESVDDDRFDF